MRPVMAHRLRTTAVAFVDVHLLVLTVDGDLDRVFPLVSELPVPYFILTFAAHVGDFLQFPGSLWFFHAPVFSLKLPLVVILARFRSSCKACLCQLLFLRDVGKL